MSLNLSGFDTNNLTDIGNILDDCSMLTTINTPSNVMVPVILPSLEGTVWHLPDGTEVTELPQNLDYSVVVTRYDTDTSKEDPETIEITTTTLELNMENVIRVKYVPYSFTIETNNEDADNIVTFSIVEGGDELAAIGLQIYPATGEIYGIPLEAGEYPITVRADYSDPRYEPSYAKLTVIVKDNTDGNVYDASDAGYELIVPVGERVEEGADDFVLRQISDQLFVSAGEFQEFIALWLNGEKLLDGVDYTKESGSTRITIIAQTFANKANHNGTNTLAMEFRKDGDESKELRRTAQNFRIDIAQDDGSGESGNGSGGNEGNNSNGSENEGSEEENNDSKNEGSGEDNNGSENEGSGEDNNGSGNEGSGEDNKADYNSSVNKDGSGSATVPAAVDTVEEMIYTVVSGDSLWKIAQQYYGAGARWQKIYADNADTIKNPNIIYAGQKIILYLRREDEAGAVSAAARTAESTQNSGLSGRTYAVVSGDSLWTIARNIYGKGKDWKKIYDANGNIIADPSHIYAGQVIIIPED